MRLHPAFMLTISLLLAGTALADDDFDASQKRSFRKFVYGREVISTLDPSAYAAFRETFDWFGMDERTGAAWDPAQGGKNVRDWCASAVRDMQEQLGRTDDRDEARMTLEAAKDRCAQVYDYRLEVRRGSLDEDGHFVAGSCKGVTSRDGTPGYSCAVKAVLRIRHFDVAFKNARGGIEASWRLDRDWLEDQRVKGTSRQEPGEVEFTEVSSSQAFVTDKRGPSATRDVAERDAANTTGAFLYRKVLNIEEFRQAAPLAYVKKGRAGFCLGSDQIYMDMPFVVFAHTADGEKKRRGFVKVREVADGCAMTTALRKRQKAGEEIDIGTSEVQIILGRAKLQPAMQAQRLPDMGLNVGASVGGSLGGISGVSLDVVAEQNLARWTHVSELHAVTRVGAVMGGGTNFVNVDLGVRKRGYLGPMFLDAGGFVHYAVDPDTEVNYFGGRIEVGLGAQISPRILLHVPLAFVGQAAEDGSGGQIAGDLHLEFLYTF
jgi:hypothetical protein